MPSHSRSTCLRHSADGLSDALPASPCQVTINHVYIAPKMHNPTWRRWTSEKHLLMTRPPRNNASSCKQLLCDIQTNCLLGLDARARVTTAHWALCVWTMCDVHNFYWERFHSKHGPGVYWHDREAAICGLSIFKNAVCSLYILFIRGPASLKESRGSRLPITSWGQRLVLNQEEVENPEGCATLSETS